MLIPVLLAGCDPRTQSERSPKSILEFFDSVAGDIKVDGIGDTLLQSAQQAENKKQYPRAMQFYQQLVDKEPDNLTYLAKLADCYRRAGQGEDAIRRYDDILAKDPNNIEALEGKGLALLSKGDFDAASNQFQSVMAKNGARWRTLNGVAILFVIKEMPKEALAYYEEALKQKPDEPAVLNNVGITLAMTQDYTRAIQALTSASERLEAGSDERKRADMNLALVYGLSGDMESAEDVASKHLKESALNNNLGFYAYLADNKELAKAYLNNALSGSSVFYEKAWKNLEIIGGTKGAEESRYSKRNHPGAAAEGAPFSSYEADEVHIESAPVAAPVSGVSGSDLNDLTPPRLPDPTPRASTPVIQPLPASTPMKPVSMNQEGNTQKVNVFPAVPVRPILDEGNVKPVAMTSAVSQSAPANLAVGDKITVPSMEEMVPKFAPETSSRMLPQQNAATSPVNITQPVNTSLPSALPRFEDDLITNTSASSAQSEQPEAPPSDIYSALYGSDTRKSLSRIRDPRGAMVVFQKPKSSKKVKQKKQGEEIVYQKKSPEAEGRLIEKKSDTEQSAEIETPPSPTLKQQVTQSVQQEAIPQEEPLLRTPAEEQDPNEITQPVQQKSTIDAFRQIF